MNAVKSRFVTSGISTADSAVSAVGNAPRCLQCHKCSAGCPVASKMDIKPSQIVRLVQLGEIDRLKASKAIWLCTTCHTCSDRCPAGVSLALMQDALKRECVDTHTSPADTRSLAAATAMLQSVADAGRMNELALMRRFKTQTNTLLERFSLGIALFFRGKLKLLRNKNKSRKRIRKLVYRFLNRTKRLSE